MIYSIFPFSILLLFTLSIYLIISFLLFSTPLGLSFRDYLKSELRRGYLLENDEERYTARREKVYTFFKIPREVSMHIYICIYNIYIYQTEFIFLHHLTHMTLSNTFCLPTHKVFTHTHSNLQNYICFLSLPTLTIMIMNALLFIKI